MCSERALERVLNLFRILSERVLNFAQTTSSTLENKTLSYAEDQRIGEDGLLGHTGSSQHIVPLVDCSL